MIKVENIESNKGNRIPNQFIIHLEEGVLFQSYDSPIVFRTYNGNVFLDENNWNYSITTSKYRSIFLNESTKETKQKIDSGRYQLVDLTRAKLGKLNIWQ